MNKYFVVSLIVLSGLIVALTACVPELLASNNFLQEFVNHELLNILAVMATVTVASAANIHLAFNRLEERSGKIGVFSTARADVNHSAMALIWLFMIAVAFLIVKSFNETLYWVSFWNGASLIILVINVFVLIDITSAVFRISPLQGDANEK